MTEAGAGGPGVSGVARVAVLISGRGTNLASLLAHPVVGPRVCLVVSSRADALGLGLAVRHGVPAAVVDRAAHADRDGFEAALRVALAEHRADWLVLAGFMHVLSDAFVARFPRRIVNIHPSLLPAFPGLHPHRRALASGATRTGCTVHLVTPGAVDGGPILAQVVVPIEPGDDEAALAARVLAAEHRLYPATVAALLGPREEAHLHG